MSLRSSHPRQKQCTQVTSSSFPAQLHSQRVSLLSLHPWNSLHGLSCLVGALMKAIPSSICVLQHLFSMKCLAMWDVLMAFG